MTWNPNDKTSKIILTEGDRRIDLTSGFGNGSVRSRHGLSSGKWYVEIKYLNISGSFQFFGFSNLSHTLTNSSHPGNDANSWGFAYTNQFFGAGSCQAHHDGSYILYGDRGGSGMVRMALDLDNKKVWWTTWSSYWHGDPTDPVSGGWALDFSGNTDELYLVLHGIRSANGFTIARGDFTSEQQSYDPPTGYLPIGDGWPVTYVFESGAFTLTGQQTTQTGGVLPVYRETNPALLDLSGSAVTFSGGAWQSARVQLDHLRASPSLILRENDTTRVLSAYCEPSQRFVGASGLVDQVLKSGKWYLEWGYTSRVWNNPTRHPGLNVMCGIVRAPENLEQMLVYDDVWMFSFGEFGSPTRVYREGTSLLTLSSDIQYFHKKGFAIDLTDPLDGKLWMHNNGVWLGGNPLTGTGGITGLMGGWHFAVSVRDEFQIDLGGVSFKPTGFTDLAGSDKFSITEMTGSTFAEVQTTGTMQIQDVSLELSVGNHLLRSTTWKKRTQYHLGLLTGMDPATEPTPSSNGYQRQAVPVSNEHWGSNFSSVQRYTFKPFDGIIVGWALFWHPTNLYSSYAHDPVIWKQEFPTPFVCSSGTPGPSFPPGLFTWSID